MADNTVFYNVKNRSSSTVVYNIPEDRIRRQFAPSEVKRISYDELLHLSYQPGGRQLMASFLQIQSEGVLNSLNIGRQAEYDMSEAQIIELLKSGSLDAFLDCLDYAPQGVLDLVKKFAVELPLSDYQKRKALLEKTGFDVDKAVENSGEETDAGAEETTAPAAAKPATGRRTTANYKVVKKEE